jgi:hypothetical protein
MGERGVTRSPLLRLSSDSTTEWMISRMDLTYMIAVAKLKGCVRRSTVTAATGACQRSVIKSIGQVAWNSWHRFDFNYRPFTKPSQKHVLQRP